MPTKSSKLIDREKIFIKRMIKKMQYDKLKTALEYFATMESKMKWVANLEDASLKLDKHAAEPDIVVHNENIQYFGKITYEMDFYECNWYRNYLKDGKITQTVLWSPGFTFLDTESLFKHIQSQFEYFKKRVINEGNN